MSEPNTPAYPEIDPQTQRHIDRLKQGSVVWNKWANDMLARKSELEKVGKWALKEDCDSKGNFRTMSADPAVPAIQQWLDEAYVDFSNFTFQTEQSSNLQVVGEENGDENSSSVKSITVSGDSIDFSYYIYPEGANFYQARFTKVASFYQARFAARANFDLAIFADRAKFHRATFTKVASFYQARFTDWANFQSCKFKGQADFKLVDFERHVDFSKAKFNSETNFEAILVKRAFSLANAEFISNIPNFTQANFAESPRLDNINVLPSLKILSPFGWQRYFWKEKYLPYVSGVFTRLCGQYPKHIWSKFTNSRRNPDEEAHYRALKRLAIQAHDHENEMKFFAGEVRARRHLTDYANFLTHDFAGSMRYWAGVLYELFSGFGRSFIRPIIWWSACLWLFANLTLSGAGLVNDKKCHNSTITPNQAAYTIGLKNSLLILGLNKTNIVKQAEQCLYGINKNRNATNKLPKHNPKIKRTYQAKTTKTDIPFKAMVQGILHSGLSILFIFLFLIAIRNQFKIK